MGKINTGMVSIFWLYQLIWNKCVKPCSLLLVRPRQTCQASNESFPGFIKSSWRTVWAAMEPFQDSMGVTKGNLTVYSWDPHRKGDQGTSWRVGAFGR
jgi:hypothetical protein